MCRRKLEMRRKRQRFYKDPRQVWWLGVSHLSTVLGGKRPQPRAHSEMSAWLLPGCRTHGTNRSREAEVGRRGPMPGWWGYHTLAVALLRCK
jgi:hypothetical protein